MPLRIATVGLLVLAVVGLVCLPVFAQGLYDCGYFNTRGAIQVSHGNSPRDPYRLGGDEDSIACESGGAKAPVSSPRVRIPDRVDAGSGGGEEDHDGLLGAAYLIGSLLLFGSTLKMRSKPTR